MTLFCKALLCGREKKFYSLAFFTHLYYNNGMRKFKYNHHIVVYALLILILIATIVGGYFAINGIILNTEIQKILAYSALAIIDLFLFIVVLGVLFFSWYQIKKDKIVIRLGVFTFFWNIEEVASLTHLIDLKKLLVTFKDGKYFFAVISTAQIEEFIKAVREINPDANFEIGYTTPQKK